MINVGMFIDGAWRCIAAYSGGTQSHDQRFSDGGVGVAVLAQSLHHHLQA